MIYFQKIEQQPTSLTCVVPAGAMLVLRIRIKSCFAAPVALQPRVEEWNDQGDETAVTARISPLYSYLNPGGEETFTLTVPLPENLKEKDRLSTRIHFSTIADCSLDLTLQTEAGDAEVKNQLAERNATLNLPLNADQAPQNNEEDRSSGHALYAESIYALSKGLESLEKTPSRALFTEMILFLTRLGYTIAKDEKNAALIHKLKRTVFFKNGALITAGSQVINWLSVSRSFHSGFRTVWDEKETEAGSMLGSWEQWMFKMLRGDIESPQTSESEPPEMPDPSLDEVMNEVGHEPEKLFLFFVLGSMEVSPRLKTAIYRVCAHIEEDKNHMDLPYMRTFDDVMNEKGSLQR